MDDLELELEDLDSALPESDTLTARILESLCEGTASLKSSNGHVPFLPEGKIEHVFTKTKLTQELRRYDRSRVEKLGKNPCSDTYLNELSDWIYQHGKKVLAITLYCAFDEADTMVAMGMFRKYNFGDNELPVGEFEEAPDHILKAFPRKYWTQIRRQHFYDHQWKFIVPVFTRARYDYDLDPKEIFPFTLDSSTLPKVGAFGAVYKARFHEKHLEDQKMLNVAVKEIKISSIGRNKTDIDSTWEREAVVLKEINKLGHPHITPCIAAIRRGDGRYFMFPWADGDNLRDFWDRTHSSPLTPELVRHAIGQLCGLAEALEQLHNIERNSSIHTKPIFEIPELERPSHDVPFIDIHDEDGKINESLGGSHRVFMIHGNLKPENILVFLDAEQGDSVFRIAGMGIAKKHIARANFREESTGPMFTTRRYEPPEATRVQSRLSDIWSMGCILFEYIIWLLYGNTVLKEFSREIDMDEGRYYETRVGGPHPEHAIRSVVRRWMEHIRKDPECSQHSAIRDLLDIVQNKLLVVNLPPDSASSLAAGTGRLFVQPVEPDSITRYRAKAIDLRNALREMLDKIEVVGPGYLLTGKSRSSIGPLDGGTSLLSEGAAFKRNAALKPNSIKQQKAPLTQIHARSYKVDHTLPTLKGWDFPIDNEFGEMVAARVNSTEAWPREFSQICAQCRELNFLTAGFVFDEEMTILQKRSETCTLCRLIHEAAQLGAGAKSQRTRIERQSSKLVIASNPLPVLSIFRGPDLKIPLPLQLGFPILPNPGSSAFFAILNLWLSDCDINHQDCHVSTKVFPTRLIDVGTYTDSRLCLIETYEEQPTDHRYIALSHAWGDVNRYPTFNTVRKDVSGAKRDVESLKERIPYEELPATFRDTVDSTRALGIRYLWIDSICIIQGPDGDFSEEAKKMEDVYSGAFCVLSANRAQNQHDGFLKPRPQPKYATLTGPGGHPYYVCQAIDNFAEDVLEGSLNQRGWVLQQRALARRTIYFSEAQTYFECGGGIRCETMTKMHNNMADFLGDPKFPTKVMRTESRALKISAFQDLYQTYSRLIFTRDDDRPFAIAGIEKRLQIAYKAKGAYGIFDDGPGGALFHRSLLWKRSEEDMEDSRGATRHQSGAMRLINFPPERNIRVPSWSWMAYVGGIEYTDPPLGSADWAKDEISPSLDMTFLNAVIRDFNLAGRLKDEAHLTYDIERTASDSRRTQCVIVARSKGEKYDRDKTHYVLLVTAERELMDRGEKVYKRVGAGFMPGKYIALHVPGIPAKIY
ncbi:heterokaryon incompatibility protein [Paraphaeosphaeria sporulosa]